MKMKLTAKLHFLAALFALCGAVDAAPATNDFPYAVQFELGDAEFAPGDSITITEVRGTRATITTNETYCVVGTYTLSSRDEAELAFFATVPNSGPSKVDPKQTVRVTKGTGTFRLIKTLEADGYLHVTFYPRPSGNAFGGVYFGQGDSVLRKKGWSHFDKQSGSSGPNQSMCEYLGDPVAPPPQLDHAYSRQGLINAVQVAAQKAGISVKTIEIDDSEFPFVIGVVTPEGAFDKLAEQFKKMDGYEYGGSVGSHSHHAFNIVPWPVFPPESSQRIGRRLTLRYQILFDKITAQR